MGGRMNNLNGLRWKKGHSNIQTFNNQKHTLNIDNARWQFHSVFLFILKVARKNNQTEPNQKWECIKFRDDKLTRISSIYNIEMNSLFGGR